MRFINQFQKSIYSPEFYAGLSEHPLSYSFRYFYSLILSLSFAGALFFAIFTAPSIQYLLKELDQKALSYYPDGLIVTIQKGVISSNASDTYQIPLPPEWKPADDATKEERDIRSLIVVDTKKNFTADIFNENKTAILVTKDAISYRIDGQIEVKPASELPDLVITKTVISYYLGKLRPIIAVFIPLSTLVVFLGVFLFFHSSLLYLLFGALVIMLIARIRKMKIGFRDSYQIGLHAITLPLIIQSLLFLAGFAYYVSFLFTLLLIIFVLINIQSIPQSLPPLSKENPEA